MRIEELVGYKNKPEYTAVKDNYYVSDLQRQLNNLGYKKYHLGNGIFGTVYSRPEDNYVVKIFQPDRGYDRYLQYMQSNLQNPYVPKLRGKPVKLPNGFTMVRIEKLKEIDSKLYQEISYLRGGPKNDPYFAGLRKSFEERYPQFLNFLDELKAMGSRGSGLALDLHSGNIMQRDNLPVVTDPFVG
jgi:hypothetical protein